MQTGVDGDLVGASGHDVVVVAIVELVKVLAPARFHPDLHLSLYQTTFLSIQMREVDALTMKCSSRWMLGMACGPEAW